MISDMLARAECGKTIITNCKCLTQLSSTVPNLITGKLVNSAL